MDLMQVRRRLLMSGTRLGPNLIQPLRNWARQGNTYGDFVVNDDGSLTLKASKVTNWNFRVQSQNRQYSLSELTGKKFVFIVDISELYLVNSADIVSGGLSTTPSASPTNVNQRTAYTNPVPWIPFTTTGKHIWVIDSFDDTFFVNKTSSFSPSNYVGAEIFLNGRSGDYVTFRSFELREMLS